MSDLKKENLLNRTPADMHDNGIRFTKEQLAEKEKNKLEKTKANDSKKEK